MLQINPDVLALIDRALAEDQAYNDATTACLIPQDIVGKAILKAKADGVLAGAGPALAVFHRIDPSLSIEPILPDGATLSPGDVIAQVDGNVNSILRAERTSLNFLQHLSGIATETARYVRAVQGFKATIVDTRKTIPGMRMLEKYAVTVGGGRNHRMNLMDGVLIKDNHITALRAQGLSLKEMVRRALEKAPHTVRVEVEVTGAEEAREALEAGANVIMLDNMPLEEMRSVVEMVDGRAVIEASGGITLETVRKAAETGVDLISVGALTHSAKALDIGLDMEEI